MNRHLLRAARPLTASLIGAVLVPFVYLVFVYVHGPLVPVQPGVGDVVGIYPAILLGAVLGLLAGWLVRRRHHARQGGGAGR